MKKFFFKSFSPVLIILALAIILVPLVVFGDYIFDTMNTGYQVMTGATKYIEVMYPDGIKDCKIINNSSTNYFIPTKYYSSEWQAFLDKTPLYVLRGCCGDGTCQGTISENFATCPQDCVNYCGNHLCDNGETIASCSFDCTYGACLQDGNEVGWISNCPLYQTSGSCDPLHCIWSGSFCSAKIMPTAATCNVITVSATCTATYGCAWVPGAHRVYWWCGDDLCTGVIGETTLSCPQDCGGAYCGDASCGSGETCTNCSEDCGSCPASCGNGLCEPSEDCCSCSSDCSTCPYTCRGPYGCEVWDKASICNSAGGGCFWGPLQCI